METITGADVVAAIVGRWEPSDLAFAEYIEYRCANSFQQAEVVLSGLLQRRDQATEGWPSETVPTFTVVLRFLGVTEFYLKEFGGTATQLLGFDIRNVSERGWENVRYLVEDYENDRIRIVCQDIEIVSVNAAKAGLSR